MKSNVSPRSCLVLSMVIFLTIIFYYISTTHSQALYSFSKQPSLISIASNSIDAKYLICENEMCGFNSIESLVEDLEVNGIDYSFSEFNLKEIHNIPATGYAYHLAQIPIPRQVYEDSKAQSIHIPLILYDRSQVYIDGNFVKDFESDSYSDTTLIYSIDPSGKPDRINFLQKGFFTGTSSGSVGFLGTLVGPSSHISKLYVMEERTQHGFALLFLAIKIGLLLVIGFLYFVVEKRSLVLYFLAFGFFQVLEPLMIGDWLQDYISLKEQVLIFFSSQSIGFYFVLRFFYTLERSKEERVFSWRWLLFASPTLIALTLVLGNYLGLFSFSINQLFKGVGVTNLLSLIFAISLPLYQKIKSKNLLNTNFRKDKLAMFAPYVLSFYSLFYLINNILLDRRGADLRYFVDIGLFFYFSLITISEFIELRDLVNRRGRELANRNIDSLIGSQASKVVHDLRRPMAAFESFIKEYELLSSDEIKVRLELLSQSLYFSQKRIGSILKEKRKMNLNLESVEIDTWISDYLEQLLFEVGEAGLDIKTNLPNNVSVYLEKDAYQSVIQNIIVNAIEAMKSGKVKSPKVLIDHGIDSSGLFSLYIENCGPHIPNDKLESIFDIGFTEGKANGTGIGLAASMNTVQRHGYRISVENNEFGVRFVVPMGLVSRGAQFRHSKLEVESENILAAQSQPQNRSIFMGNVYLVEDDPLVALSWKLKWKEKKGSLFHFSKPSEFFREIESGSLNLTDNDLVVTDYHFENEKSTNGLIFANSLQGKFGFHNIALNTGDITVEGGCSFKVWPMKASFGPDEINQHI